MQTKPRELHYLARTLFLAVPAVSIGIQLATWISFALGEGKHQIDFFAYYDAGYMLRTGHVANFYHEIRPPWFGFIHPAYESLIFVPFSFLAPYSAYVVWILVEVAITCLIIRLLWRELEHLRSVSLMTPVALALSFFPVSYAVAQGQDSFLLALLMVLAFVKIKSGHEYYAGILLGLGVFRFQIVLPMIILFVVWKSWRLLAGVLTSAACVLSFSLAMTGISGQLQYLKLLSQLAEPASQYVQQMPNLRGVFAAFGVSSQPVLVSASVICLVVLALLGRRLPPGRAFLFAGNTGCVLSYHLYLHDFVLLLAPLLVLSDLFLEDLNYPGLASLAAMIVLPIATIMIGSVMALWVCAFIPLSLMALIAFSGMETTESCVAIGPKWEANELLEVQ